MKPRSSSRRLLAELLRGMAICDPYGYSHLVSLEADPCGGSIARTPQKAAIGGSARLRRAWDSSTQR